MYQTHISSAKDENESSLTFVDTLIYPTVKIDQSLFTSGEPGNFDFYNL